MSKVNVRAAEQPRRKLLLPAAIALSAAFVVGTAVAVEAQDEAAAEGIDGTWTVDTSIGTFDDFSSSWVGFRVSEVLNPGGEVDAVGRTPVVSLYPPFKQKLTAAVDRYVEGVQYGANKNCRSARRFALGA